MSATNTSPEIYSGCQRCKRPYPEPCEDLLCGECETRCPTCGAPDRGCCQNPDEFMLAVQSKVYTAYMIKHRRAGEELWWFKAMDTANKAASEPDPNDR